MEVYPVSCDHRKVAESGGLLTAQTKMFGSHSQIPDGTPFLHIDWTTYFYPDDRNYPKCHGNLFVDVNMPGLLLDWLSLEWLSQLTLSCAKAVSQMLKDLELDKQAPKKETPPH